MDCPHADTSFFVKGGHLETKQRIDMTEADTEAFFDLIKSRSACHQISANRLLCLRDEFEVNLLIEPVLMIHDARFPIKGKW